MTAKARKVRRKGMDPWRAIWRGPLLVWVLFLGVALLLTGCPKKPEVQTGVAGATAPGEPTIVEEEEEEVVIVEEPVPEVVVEEEEEVVVVEEVPLKDVFFDFDKSVIREDAKITLGDNIQWLRDNPDVRILVEGHCDERGTNEYNLALGERRAKDVRDYLVAGGINSARISTISYGEERPFVVGHDESVWKWNRRGHFVLVQSPIEDQASPTIHHPPTPPAGYAPPQIVWSADSVMAVIKEYRRAYEQRDLEAFVHLWGKGIRDRDLTDREELRYRYAANFGALDQIRYELKEVTMSSISGGRLTVSAGYRITANLRPQGKKIASEGRIRWTLREEKGELRIVAIDY